MKKHTKFDDIRPFHDSEVHEALQSIRQDPMMEAIMHFTFPNKTEADWLEILKNIHSTHAFQGQVVHTALTRILKESCSEGMTTSGFENLKPDTAYLFISNHRDIILDTSLLNMTLYDFGLILTASAIGDNLVKNPFIYTLSKINRNFLVLRGLPPRELLRSSALMAEYIHDLITHENRSVWLAQREGRTKDGLDTTHPGVLKMLSIPAKTNDLSLYFRTLNIVPISISYEYDPTDSLKVPELVAYLNNEKYIKSENEDFNSLYNGLIGQKKRIHIHAGKVLFDESLRAEVSSRRVDMAYLDFINYAMASPRTYAAHDISGRKYMYPVVLLCALAYFPAIALYKGYDPLSNGFSLIKLISPASSVRRIDPTANIV